MNVNISNRQLFHQYLGQTSPSPMNVEVAGASHIYVYSPDGKKYIDLISGIAVNALGHNHRRVVQAITEQAAKYLHVMVYGEYVQSPQVRLASALAETLPPQLGNVFFVNSGSEATEGAMKLAKRYTGRYKILACEQAYHGASQGALSLCSEASFTQAFRPLLPGIGFIRYGEMADIGCIDETIAAVFIEVVQGEAGVRTNTSAYFQALRQRCNETGTLLVLDEIQSGFGRTGKFWAFEYYGIVPDILLTAKGMGGGMPLGAFISSKEIMSALQTNPVLGHITTFGGHPVSCAASLAVLQELQETAVYKLAGQKAELFRDYLRHEKIVDIRNLGLMMAVQFDSFERVSKIIRKSMDLGLLTDWFLFCDNAIRIAPPLTITDEEIKAACDIVLQAIEESG